MTGQKRGAGAKREEQAAFIPPPLSPLALPPSSPLANEAERVQLQQATTWPSCAFSPELSLRPGGGGAIDERGPARSWLAGRPMPRSPWLAAAGPGRAPQLSRQLARRDLLRRLLDGGLGLLGYGKQVSGMLGRSWKVLRCSQPPPPPSRPNLLHRVQFWNFLANPG